MHSLPWLPPKTNSISFKCISVIWVFWISLAPSCFGQERAGKVVKSSREGRVTAWNIDKGAPQLPWKIKVGRVIWQMENKIFDYSMKSFLGIDGSLNGLWLNNKVEMVAKVLLWPMSQPLRLASPHFSTPPNHSELHPPWIFKTIRCFCWKITLKRIWVWILKI